MFTRHQPFSTQQPPALLTQTLPAPTFASSSPLPGCLLGHLSHHTNHIQLVVFLVWLCAKRAFHSHTLVNSQSKQASTLQASTLQASKATETRCEYPNLCLLCLPLRCWLHLDILLLPTPHQFSRLIALHSLPPLPPPLLATARQQAHRLLLPTASNSQFC